MSQKRAKTIRRLERRVRDLEEEVKFLHIVRQMELMDTMDAIYEPVPPTRRPGLFRRLFRNLFA